jgi:hypothetical protein
MSEKFKNGPFDIFSFRFWLYLFEEMGDFCVQWKNKPPREGLKTRMLLGNVNYRNIVALHPGFSKPGGGSPRFIHQN